LQDAYKFTLRYICRQTENDERSIKIVRFFNKRVTMTLIAIFIISLSVVIWIIVRSARHPLTAGYIDLSSSMAQLLKNQGNEDASNKLDKPNMSDSPALQNKQNLKDNGKQPAMARPDKSLPPSGESTSTPNSKQRSKPSRQSVSPEPTSGTHPLIININTATLEQLLTLPRIGESKAKAIISYRQVHGRFVKPEQLMQVKGIGDKIFADIRPMISTIDP
jgi:competence ComEA-like helix-hairpin-helix protein